MRTVAVIVLLTFAASAVATAQPAAPPPSTPPSAGEVPVSLARIKRQLGEASPPRDAAGLRLHYYLDVLGKMPPLELFTNFDLELGPVPYGGPTHSELIRMVTPQEFQSPPANLMNVAQALAQWFAKRAAEKKARRPR